MSSIYYSWKLIHIALLTGLCFQSSYHCLAQAGQLSIAADFTTRELAPDSLLELQLSRALVVSEGNLAIFINTIDVTSLVTISGVNVRYRPWPLPLPIGESKVTVYLVRPQLEWRQLAVFIIHVTAFSNSQPLASEATAPTEPAVPSPPVDASKNGWSISPALTISSKSQPGAWYRPAQLPSDRGRFSDLTMQGGLKINADHAWFGLQSQFDVAGSSHRRDALRYGTLGAEAPRVDLANYLMQFKLGQASFNAGHFAYGGSRQLIKDFVSRGLTFTAPIGRRVDFSVAAMNGSTILGWGNFFGIDRGEHQIVSGRIGIDMLERPGALRFEASALHGSLLPIASYNQSNINDAEKSRGESARLLASDKAQRFQLDMGFARSRSFNPADPLVDQGMSVVAVRPETRNAHYLDVSYKVLNDLPLGRETKANLQISLQHERVDPLFRSVGADLQANKLFNQAGLAGSIGEINAVYSFTRFEDNLDRIPSLLKSRTERQAFLVSLPMTHLFERHDSTSRPHSVWLPRISYSHDRTHQRGLQIPVNADFKAPQVPDQIGTSYDLVTEWQGQRWRYSYHLNHSAQDNFGEKREGTRLRNLVNGVTIGFAPSTALGLNADVQFERALSEDTNANKDSHRTDRTFRVGFFVNWRPTSRMTVTANLANTSLHTMGDLSFAGSNRTAQFDLQWSWRFSGRSPSEDRASGRSRFKLQTMFYVRYAHRSARVRQELFGIKEFNRGDTLNSGLSFTIF